MLNTIYQCTDRHNPIPLLNEDIDFLMNGVFS